MPIFPMLCYYLTGSFEKSLNMTCSIEIFHHRPDTGLMCSEWRVTTVVTGTNERETHDPGAGNTRL